ncbi:MAG: signal peptidase I [Clostridia bacterium]
MKNSKKIICSKIVKYTLRIILILLVLYNLIYVIGHEYDKEFNIKLFGVSAIVVENNSMEPEINKKNVVIVKRTEELVEGDVITFYQDGQLKIRRIVKVNDKGVDETYITKGDNYFYYDEKEIGQSQVEGKVIKVLKASGTIIRMLQSKGLMIFNTIILLLIFLYNKRLQQKRKKRRERTLGMQK